MAIAAFDMDHTLLDTDSEINWHYFLIEKGLVDVEKHRAKAKGFNDAYLNGTLDSKASNLFSASTIAQFSPEQRLKLFETFKEERIRPYIRTQVMQWVEDHRAKGDTVVLITATISLLANGLGKELGFEHVIGSPSGIDEQGNAFIPEDIPSAFHDGKPYHLNAFAKSLGLSMQGSWGYSDSHNDIPLLEMVDHPVVVTPDDKLLKYGRDKGWKIYEQVS